MKRRKIIEIDEDKCNGCGQCVTGCAEGALALVDGKARLVNDVYCDGFGDCIGACPTGALRITEREADGFDEEAAREHVRTLGGPEAVQRMDEATSRHSPPQAPPPGGCPGLRTRSTVEPAAAAMVGAHTGLPSRVIASDLCQWPVQLHLVSPQAPYFKGKELVVLSTCAPVASADVHWRFLRGRSVVVACPKLDRTEPYAGKLADLLREPTIPRVLVVRMTVPCCGGLTAIVREAARRTGRSDLQIDEVMIDIDGSVQEVREIQEAG